MIRLPFKKTTLPNGVRVITVPMKNTSTVTSVVMVKTGSRYERRRENGISHVLEHLFFQGTKKRPEHVSAKRELDRVGAVSNAFTSQDHTGYWVKADMKYLDLSLDILSDMYLNALFRPGDIEKERRVVVEEINMYEDTPQRKVWDNFYELLYPGSSLGWNITGPVKTVLSLEKKDFLEYREKFYTAANTVVVVAGNMNEKATHAKIARFFRSVRKGSASSFASFSDQQKRPLAHFEHKPIDQAHVVLGVKAYSLYDKKRYALEVLSALLGGYFSARLVVSVRDKLGLAYYVGADIGHHEDTGYFGAYAGLNLKNAELGIKTIVRELDHLKTGPLPEKEVEDAKSHIEGATSLSLESSAAIAMSVGTSEVMRGTIETPAEHIRKIRQVTAADVRAVARELFKKEKLNLAVIGPFKDTKPFEKLLTI